MRTHIYLASRWSRQLLLRHIRDQFHRTTECRVVSRWIDFEGRLEDFMSEDAKQRMRDDLFDIQKCDLLVADILGGMGRRGGMMLEVGYALARGKRIILIGNPADCGIFGNVFNKTFADWQEAFDKYF